MKEYEINFWRSNDDYGYIIVSASSEEEAEKIANKAARNDELILHNYENEEKWQQFGQPKEKDSKYNYD